MSANRKQDPFVKSVEAMEKGFQNFPTANAELNFRRETLTPAQVVQRLQGIVDLYHQVDEAKAAYEAAVKALQRAMPADHTFFGEAVTVVQSHFGSDPRVMATFGLRAQRQARPVATEVVILEDLPREPVVEEEEEEVIEVPARGDRVEVEEVVEVLERGGKRVEVETRVEEAPPKPHRRPRRHARPARGSRR